MRAGGLTWRWRGPTQAERETVEGSFYQTTLWSLEPKMCAPRPVAVCLLPDLTC